MYAAPSTQGSNLWKTMKQDSKAIPLMSLEKRCCPIVYICKILVLCLKALEYGEVLGPDLVQLFWAQQDSGEMAQKWEQIPSSTDILVTHSPPFNIIDLAFMEVENPSNEICNTCGQAHPNFFHWGSKTLLQRVFQLKPKVHLYGHVHDGAPRVGLVQGLSTLFINAAQDLNPKPIFFDCYL